MNEVDAIVHLGAGRTRKGLADAEELFILSLIFSMLHINPGK